MITVSRPKALDKHALHVDPKKKEDVPSVFFSDFNLPVLRSQEPGGV